jgi:NADH-quinone oxidoreductase subunit C
MIPQEIASALSARFGDALLEASIDGVLNPSLKIAPARIEEIARFLRDDPGMRFDTLSLLSGMDYTGGRLGVVYHLASVALGHTIVLKTVIPADQPHVPSVAAVWRTADWHEREAFDMYGIVFDGHPDLRRILMPDDWEGHPLRKDYTVPEFYHGMKVPY